METAIEAIPSMDDKAILRELQTYQETKNFAMMSKFLDKVPFPKTASNDNLVRYNYYKDFIKDLKSKHLREIKSKTDIRNIARTYSRIYVKDIAKKLEMSKEDAIYLVIKSIKEDNINATLIYDMALEEHYLQTTEVANIYQTTEPQLAFDARIRSCLELHNSAVKGML